MRSSKLRAALLVFFVGFSLGLSVFAASRMFVRSVLGSEATAVAEQLAQRLAAGDDNQAIGNLPGIVRYHFLSADGEVLQSSEAGATAASAAPVMPEIRDMTDLAGTGETVVNQAPLVASLLGLSETSVTSVAVPVVSDGGMLGGVHVEVDQTEAEAALARAFSVIGMVSVGLAVLALIVVMAAGRSGRLLGGRRAFDPTTLPHDPLTRLANREGFTTALGHATASAAAADQQVGLMIISLVQFRTVNDIWGHAVGDAVLKSVAERLRAFAAPGMLARISGDNFALVVERDATTHSIRQLAEQVQKALGAPYDVSGSSITLGAHIGAALFPVNADSPDMLFRAADTALSKAKSEGHSALVFFDTEMKRRMERRAELERDLRHALERNEFVLFYQPQLELASGRLRGYEALLRWERPGEGILPPGEFLTVAQETGLIGQVGNWVLRKACEDAAGWQDGGAVAVNFCAAQFRSESLDQVIAETLATTGLAAERLEIEVPESLFLQRAPEVMATLSRIKALGVKVVMDDFGGGYSGLTSLARFPFDKIKIDKGFVSQLTEDADVAAIVASIVGLGRSMTLDITAEGVETGEQVTLLRAAGCTIVQGFRFGMPQRAGAGPGAAGEEGDSPAAEPNRAAAPGG